MKTLTTAILALLAAAMPVAGQQKVKERTDAPADGIVVIKNLGGRLRVIGTDRNEVVVEGTLTPQEAKLDVGRSGVRTFVKVTVPHGTYSKSVGGDLIVHVPRGSRVEAHTVTAPIEVSGVRGSLAAKTMHGVIRVADSPRIVSAESMAGDIFVTGSSDSLRAHSVGGSLTLDRLGGWVDVSSVNGMVHLVNADVRSGTIRSVSGEILYDGALGGKGALELANVSGPTVLRLARSVAASFQVKSFSGEIQNDFGATAVRTSKYVPSKELIFSVGSGGGSVVVNTTSGDVQIRKKQ